MKRRTIIAITAAAIGLAAIPLVYAGVTRHGGVGCPFSGGRHGFGMIRHVQEELDLNEEQTRTLMAIARKTREENETVHATLKANFGEAAQVLLNDPANVAGARAVLQKNEAPMEQVKTSVLNAVSEGLKVLTPEQRQKAAELLAKHHAQSQ